MDVLDDPHPGLDETTLVLCDDSDSEDEVYLYMESVIRACLLALQDGLDRVVCVEPGRDISVRDALTSLRWWILQHSGVYSKAIAADMRWIADQVWTCLHQDTRLNSVRATCHDILSFLM